VQVRFDVQSYTKNSGHGRSLGIVLKSGAVVSAFVLEPCHLLSLFQNIYLEEIMFSGAVSQKRVLAVVFSTNVALCVSLNSLIRNCNDRTYISKFTAAECQ
jgi:hypothetical protein